VAILGRGFPIPPSDASAVVVTLTAIDGAPGGGFVTAYPFQGSYPPVSNVNLSDAGDVRANLAIVPLGESGAIDVRMASVNDVAVDIVGYITGSSAAPGGGELRVISPTRVVDTRSGLGFGRMAAGTALTFNPAVVPDEAAGLLQNTVLVNPAGPTFLTTWPAGAAQPLASSNNAIVAGQVHAALAATPLGAGGTLAYYTLDSTDLVVDITGYFVG